MTKRNGADVAESQTRDRQKSRRYWWMLTQGVCAILFGLLAIFWPHLTISLFLYVFGVYAILEGLAPLSQAIFGGKHAQTRGRWVLFLEGTVSIVCGFLSTILARSPGSFLAYIIAIWLLFKGVSFLMQTKERGWMMGLVGLLALLAGFYLLLHPTSGFRTLLLLLGIFALIMGVLLLIRGWRARPTHRTPEPHIHSA